MTVLHLQCFFGGVAYTATQVVTVPLVPRLSWNFTLPFIEERNDELGCSGKSQHWALWCSLLQHCVPAATWLCWASCCAPGAAFGRTALAWAQVPETSHLVCRYLGSPWAPGWKALFSRQPHPFRAGCSLVVALNYAHCCSIT